MVSRRETRRRRGGADAPLRLGVSGRAWSGEWAVRPALGVPRLPGLVHVVDGEGGAVELEEGETVHRSILLHRVRDVPFAQQARTDLRVHVLVPHHADALPTV